MGVRNNLIIVIVMLVIVFCLGSYQYSSQQEQITNKLQSELNVAPTNIEEENPYWGGTPFTWNTKGTRVYRFTYNKDGQEKHGWVRFQSFSTDWIMEGDNV
jgi:hypothetical protein